MSIWKEEKFNQEPQNPRKLLYMSIKMDHIKKLYKK
jgi:hypothetical protein